MKTNLEKTCATLGALSRGDLLKLRGIIDHLLEAIDPTDQTAPDVHQSVAQNPKAGQGYIELKMIPKKGKGGQSKAYGPYKYLRFREGGVYRSVYLGKSEGSK